MRERYLQMVRIEESQAPILPLLLNRYKMDYLLISESARLLVSMPLLQKNAQLVPIHLPCDPVVSLWRIMRFPTLEPIRPLTEPDRNRTPTQ